MIFRSRFLLPTLLLVLVMSGHAGVVLGAQADSRAALDRDLAELDESLSVDNVDTTDPPESPMVSVVDSQRLQEISRAIEETNPFSQHLDVFAIALRDFVVKAVFGISKAVLSVTAVGGFWLSKVVPSMLVAGTAQAIALVSVLGVLAWEIRTVLQMDLSLQ